MNVKLFSVLRIHYNFFIVSGFEYRLSFDESGSRTGSICRCLRMKKKKKLNKNWHYIFLGRHDTYQSSRRGLRLSSKSLKLIQI
jgi:hypothetical protein